MGITEEEQGRTASRTLKSYEEHRTLMVDLEWGKKELTGAEEAAEDRRVSLVRSGWCSGRRWGKGEGRRRWQSLKVGRREEEDDAKRHEGEKWKGPLDLIYKVNG